MTDTQISELTQNVIDGQEDPAKALDIVWKIKEGNEFATKCWNKILEVLWETRTKYCKATLIKWNALNSQTPKMEYKTNYRSQWVEAEDGFNYSSNRLDNQRRDYKNSIDHF